MVHFLFNILWFVGLCHATQLPGSQQVDFGSLRTKIVTVAPQPTYAICRAREFHSPQPEFQNLPTGASFCLFPNTHKKFESRLFENSYFYATFEPQNFVLVVKLYNQSSFQPSNRTSYLITVQYQTFQLINLSFTISFVLCIKYNLIKCENVSVVGFIISQTNLLNIVYKLVILPFFETTF